jgi:hypothetical protein
MEWGFDSRDIASKNKEVIYVEVHNCILWKIMSLTCYYIDILVLFCQSESYLRV